MTGDFVSWGGDYEQTFAFIRRLKAKIGVWAVLGDSDYQNSRKVWGIRGQSLNSE
jgi:hypothetical protein